MAPEQPVVEDEVLQLPALDRHEHGPVGAVERREPRAARARASASASVRQARHAHAAAEAAVRVDAAPRSASGGAGRWRRPRRAPRPGRRATQRSQPVQAASSTAGRKCGRVDRGASAAKRRAAIIASQQQPQQLQMKFTPLADVLAELDEVRAPGPACEQVEPLRDVDLPGVAVPDERRGRRC